MRRIAVAAVFTAASDLSVVWPSSSSARLTSAGMERMRATGRSRPRLCRPGVWSAESSSSARTSYELASARRVAAGAPLAAQRAERRRTSEGRATFRVAVGTTRGLPLLTLVLQRCRRSDSSLWATRRNRALGRAWGLSLESDEVNYQRGDGSAPLPDRT